MAPGAGGVRIAVVGLGDVGEACAHALAMSDLVHHLVLLNRTVQRAENCAHDLRQARAWGQRLTTESGTAAHSALLQGCDLVVLALGQRLRGSQSRQAVARAATEIYQKSGVIEGLRDLSAEGEMTSVLVVTNPVETTVTWLAGKTGIPRTRMFGLGTTVESARCSEHLARSLGVDAVSAWVHVIGEHGPGLVFPDQGRLGSLADPRALAEALRLPRGRTLGDAAVIRRRSEEVGLKAARGICESLRARLGEGAKEDALEWLEDELAAQLAPPATRFAIAACVVEVARAIARDSDWVLTVSALPPDALKLLAVALSLPFAVRRGGLGACHLHEASEELKAVARKLHDEVQRLNS